MPRRSLCALAVGAALLLGSCSSSSRSIGAFCDRVRADQPALAGTPIADAANTVRRYQEVAKVAPEAIRDDWLQLTELMVQAAAVDPGQPDEQAQLTEAAYAASRAAASVTTYVKATCGVELGPVATTTAPTTTTPPTTTPPTTS